MGGLVLVGNLFQNLGQLGRAIVRRNWHILLLLAVWLTASWVLLARRDLVIPLPFSHPLFPFQDILIIGVFDFIKLVLIGMMVKNIAPILAKDITSRFSSAPSMPRWIVISFFFALSLIAINAVQLQLEFGGAEPLSPAVTIAVKLGFTYLSMIILWVAVFFYVAARSRLVDLIVATTVIYLVPASLITTLILYAPFVAPFWFGLDQLGGEWTALVQTVSVLAETCAALIYAVFIAGAAITLAKTKDADSLEPAS